MKKSFIVFLGLFCTLAKATDGKVKIHPHITAEDAIKNISAPGLSHLNKFL